MSEKELTSREKADLLSEKAFEELDIIINKISEKAKNLSQTYSYDCPQNPLEISKCNQRADSIKYILTSTKQARDYITRSTVLLENTIGPGEDEVKENISQRISNKLGLIRAYEDIGKIYQSECPLSEGNNCNIYLPKVKRR